METKETHGGGWYYGVSGTRYYVLRHVYCSIPTSWYCDYGGLRYVLCTCMYVCVRGTSYEVLTVHYLFVRCRPSRLAPVAGAKR